MLAFGSVSKTVYSGLRGLEVSAGAREGAAVARTEEVGRARSRGQVEEEEKQIEIG